VLCELVGPLRNIIRRAEVVSEPPRVSSSGLFRYRISRETLGPLHILYGSSISTYRTTVDRKTLPILNSEWDLNPRSLCSNGPRPCHQCDRRGHDFIYSVFSIEFDCFSQSLKTRDLLCYFFSYECNLAALFVRKDRLIVSSLLLSPPNNT
jgi:hypothetical protein